MAGAACAARAGSADPWHADFLASDEASYVASPTPTKDGWRCCRREGNETHVDIGSTILRPRPVGAGRARPRWAGHYSEPASAGESSEMRPISARCFLNSWGPKGHFLAACNCPALIAN